MVPQQVNTYLFFVLLWFSCVIVPSISACATWSNKPSGETDPCKHSGAPGSGGTGRSGWAIGVTIRVKRHGVHGSKTHKPCLRRRTTPMTTLQLATTTRPMPPATTTRPMPPATTTRVMPPATTTRVMPPATTTRPMPPATTTRPIPPATTTRPMPPATTTRPIPPATTTRPIPRPTQLPTTKIRLTTTPRPVSRTTALQKYTTKPKRPGPPVSTKATAVTSTVVPTTTAIAEPASGAAKQMTSTAAPDKPIQCMDACRKDDNFEACLARATTPSSWRTCPQRYAVCEVSWNMSGQPTSASDTTSKVQTRCMEKQACNNGQSRRYSICCHKPTQCTLPETLSSIPTDQLLYLISQRQHIIRFED